MQVPPTGRSGSPTTVRSADLADAAGIRTLWDRNLAEGSGTHPPVYSPEHLVSDLERRLILVAESERGIVGVVRFTPIGRSGSIARGREAEVSRIAVAPEHRRQGVGTLLMQCAHAECRASGANRAIVSSRPSEDAAHRLFESLRYRRESARDHRDEAGLRRLVYSLDL